MAPRKAPAGPGLRDSQHRAEFANSRMETGGAVLPPQQLCDMHELREATEGMSLAQLEAHYKTRFHEGEIKEMKHEFDNMVRASQDRSRMRLGDEADAHPDASCLAASELEDLIARIERTSSRQVDPVAVQKVLALLLECRPQADSRAAARADTNRYVANNPTIWLPR